MKRFDDQRCSKTDTHVLIAAYLEDSALLPKLKAVLEFSLDVYGEENALPWLRFNETVS